MLCGYSPFRSDDVKELIRETTEAKIEFHERYWGNVSPEGMLRLRFLFVSASTQFLNSQGLCQIPPQP